MEQNPLGCGSNDEGNDNSNYGSEDYYNNNEDNNEDHIEVDAEQAYSRRESNTPMVEEVDNDNVVEVDVAEVYSRRHGKKPMTQHPSEDNDVIDSSDSRGGDGEGSVEDEDVVNHAEGEFVEDSSDSWDGSNEDVTELVQMGADVMNSDYENGELHNLEKSSFDDDIGDDIDDSSEDELKTPVGKGMGQKRTFPVFKPVVKVEHFKFEKDMLFTTPKQLKEAVTDYAVHGGWGIRFVKNDL